MYQFDELVTQECTKREIKYTRYADDLTFSTNSKGILFDIPQYIAKTLRSLFGDKIIINRRKTVFSSKAHNRHVTGVTIDNHGQLSLGRERKRYIKHLVYQYKQALLDIEDISHLRGLLAFAQHIEPDFIARLATKYSASIISQIFGEKYE